MADVALSNSTAIIDLLVAVQLGGEALRMGGLPRGELRKITALERKYDIEVLVKGADAQAYTTLWDTTFPVTYELMVILSDPEWVRDADQLIELRITDAQPVEIKFALSRNVPMLFSGVSDTGIAAIEKIEVANLAGTVDCDDDVKVRFLLLDDQDDT